MYLKNKFFYQKYKIRIFVEYNNNYKKIFLYFLWI